MSFLGALKKLLENENQAYRTFRRFARKKLHVLH